MASVYAEEGAPTRGAVRYAYLGFGLFFVCLGTAGMFLPVLPTTIFYILALWAFKKSSPPLEDWLLNHKVVGPALQDWEKNKAIRKRTKVVAITMIWLSIVVSALLVRKPYVAVILVITAVALTAYLWTRNTAPEPA